MRAQGIYIDEAANNLEIGGNTVAFCGRSGVYCHNAHELNFHNNTLFDNTVSSISYYNDGGTLANITYQNNINFCKTSSELVFESSGSSAWKSFFATADNNYYCRPISEASDFRASIPSWTFWSLAAWKTFTGKDAHSSLSPRTITSTSGLQFFYNNTSAAKTFTFSGTYVDVHNTSYTGSVTLQPWTSVVLISTTGSTTKAETNTTEIVSPAALNAVSPVFVLYPNPVTDNFSVELTNGETGQMKVEIVSVSGQVMRSLMLNKEQQSTQFNLPSNNLSKGVYFIQIQVGNWNGTKRFVKL
jgi:parallel beta-helix repeat protein